MVVCVCVCVSGDGISGLVCPGWGGSGLDRQRLDSGRLESGMYPQIHARIIIVQQSMQNVVLKSFILHFVAGEISTELSLPQLLQVSSTCMYIYVTRSGKILRFANSIKIEILHL